MYFSIASLTIGLATACIVNAIPVANPNVLTAPDPVNRAAQFLPHLTSPYELSQNSAFGCPIDRHHMCNIQLLVQRCRMSCSMSRKPLLLPLTSWKLMEDSDDSNDDSFQHDNGFDDEAQKFDEEFTDSVVVR
ncbi:hypothetical protein EV359DRAFT_83694 [Lentinula novae-zelandiae]|nr:hypothetical protein EV359DRAFT_83694 [Lentinula novae-zelandiae]